MLGWLHSHILLLSISLGVALLGCIGGTIYLIRMPPDTLIKKPRGRHWLRIARNILGWLLIAAGIVMFVLPAPGIIFILLGMTMADFPGKQRLQRWLLARRHLVSPINHLRKYFGHSPLKTKKAVRNKA